jgi:hypothetical protein
LVAFRRACPAAVVAVRARLLAARPEVVWLLARCPIARVAARPAEPRRVAVALVELAALVPLHAFVTLLRAARLEGGETP